MEVIVQKALPFIFQILGLIFPKKDQHLKKIGKVLSKLVNDNNKAFFNANDLLFFVSSFIQRIFNKEFLSYFLIAIKSFSKPWYKAIFLDFFLANFHLKLHQKYKTDLSSVF